MKTLIAILLFCVFASCKTPNLFVNDKMEIESSNEEYNNRLGVWLEAKDRAVAGHSRGEMQKDSTYRMQTLDGWVMTIRFDRITWAQQLKFSLPTDLGMQELENLKSFRGNDHGF